MGLSEFEHALRSACEEALLEILGASGFASTVYHLSKEGISLPDIASRPTEFDDALSAIFQPVPAMLIEGRILKRFYRSIGAKFEWNNGRVFSEEVEEAKRRYAVSPITKEDLTKHGGNPERGSETSKGVQAISGYP